MGKWIFEKITSGNEPEKEIPLSPFPIKQPVVYHFNPVAFVEQMRRVDTGLKYEIHFTGKIIQYGEYKTSKEVTYVYIDKTKESHYLGTWVLIDADKYANGTKTKIEASKCHSEYSSYYKCMIYYKRLDGKVKLLNYKDKKVNYSKGNVSISYNFKSTIDRKYADPEAFAVLIGALAKLGADYKDVTINGFTDITGTGSPSVTHPRGINFDMRLLNKSKKIKPLLINDVDLDVVRNNKLLDALHKFGYTKVVSNYYKSNKLLNHCVKDRYNKHKDHLHVQGYKPNLEKR